MSLQQLLLLKVPSLILGIIIVSSAVILSALGLRLVRRSISHHRLKLHNDVAGPIFGTLGVVYAVLLAFAVIIVWENFDKSSSNVKKEASRLVQLSRDSEAFAPEFEKQIHLICHEYAQSVINDEWPMLAQGIPSPKTEAILNRMWTLYTHYLPKNMTEESFYKESARNLNELGELRMTRLEDAHTGVQPILWFVLVLGGVITVAFTFFFGTENLRAQMVMTIMLAVIISLILYTILLMDFPFTGDVCISSEPFRDILL